MPIELKQKQGRLWKTLSQKSQKKKNQHGLSQQAQEPPSYPWKRKQACFTRPLSNLPKFTRIYFSCRTGFTAPSKGFRSHPGYQGKGPDLPGPPMPEGVPLSRSPPAVDKVLDQKYIIKRVVSVSDLSSNTKTYLTPLNSTFLTGLIETITAVTWLRLRGWPQSDFWPRPKTW